MKKSIIFLFAVIFCTCSFSYACAREHVHSFQYYIAKQPACEEKGILECLCEECGYKTYQDIEALGHAWKNGICERCGEKIAEEQPPTTDVSKFITLEKAYEKSAALGYLYTKTEFLSISYDAEFTSLHINSRGNLKVNAEGISANAGKIREDIPLPGTAELGEILRAEISKGEVLLSDKFGTTINFGKIADYFPDEENPVCGAAINLQNELLISYKDNTVRKAGIIATEPYDEDDSLLLYLQNGVNYSVYGPFDKHTETAFVPKTHFGRPVKEIYYAAFRNCAQLKSITLSEGITDIGKQAFEFCDALEEIVLPSSLHRIYIAAFKGCTALERVWYCGGETSWDKVFIGVSNDAIQNAEIFFYSETEPVDEGNYWHYVNGVPVSW